MNLYRFYFKRLFDFFLALISLIVLSPLILIISCILFIYNQGKVFFIQERPGKNEKIFFILKFKTMRDLFDETGSALPDSERITSFGIFIRKLSLDELPQLVNVLIGNMSFIGPRPLLTEYIPLYSKSQKRRHEVRPGITGWAQVNGRNAISWQRKFELDVWYVDNCSFLLDIKIIILTILKVLKSEGISSENSITANKFSGNN